MTHARGCCCSGCDDLPDRIRVTIQGRASFFREIDRPGEGRSSISDILNIPPIIFTADKANGYRTTLACPALIFGAIRSESESYIVPGTPTVNTGQAYRVSEVQVSAGNIDPGNPGSLCVLSSVTVVAEHSSSVEDSDGFLRSYSARYDSLQEEFLGLHEEFGHGLIGSFYENEPGTFEGGPLYIVASVSNVALPPSLAQYSVETPSPYTVNSLSSGITNYSHAHAPWTVLIEPHDGDPICDASPIVYAVRCGDDPANPVEKITVDLIDRLDGVPSSLPFYDDSVWVPTDEQSPETVTTHLWVEGVCDTTEYPVYELCGGGDRVVVDESNKPVTALSCIYQSRRYVPTGEVSLGPTVNVIWSDDECPMDDLWERCVFAPNQPIPNRIRFDRDQIGSDYALVYQGYEVVDSGELCSELWEIGYRLIPDDGDSEAPDWNPALARPKTGPCDAINDRRIRRQCTRLPDEPDDPVDPFPDSLTNPDPAGPNPMDRVFRDQTARSTCEGCSDSLEGFV